MYTVSLQAAGHEQRERIGSKALQLSRLIRKRVCVPDGFIITADALERFLTANRLQDRLDAEDVGAQFSQAEIPPDLRDEIASSYYKLLGSTACAVAVRSSASAEDLPDASFAGQYETILNVTRFSHLLSSIKRCWGSLYSSQVKQYAHAKNISPTDLPMGILVQQMIAADVSGVIFSMNPVTGNKDEIMINASYGLGESIVSGLVTPDTFIFNKKTAQLEKELGPKELKIVPDAHETRELETSLEEQNQYCLQTDMIHELARETEKIERFYQQPVDIEFAIKDSQLYILQVRPITT